MAEVLIQDNSVTTLSEQRISGYHSDDTDVEAEEIEAPVYKKKRGVGTNHSHQAIVNQWIATHKDFQYTDFDAFSKDIEEASVHCLQLVEDDYLRGKCSCLAFAKQHLFKHILAVSAQLKLADRNQ
ncbi:hypothetical protein BpHYR1_013270 [Brachionus plicatilis]|uniref:Uncharacterized protein n=1 Tax=Brachionus plicatilis TaxID=10195 RepID=A0A3M7SQY3_BRAPC|nr:hypothetical protein BpHYR1_013270 [Brachionus plicatilis]